MKLIFTKLIIQFFLFCLILVGIILTLPYLGVWLVRRDNLAESDAIVILMGSIVDRTIEAYDVYTSGYSNRIIIVEPYLPVKEKAIEQNFLILDNATITKNALVSKGIPYNNIVIIPSNANSTEDEAIAVREYIESNHKINSIILISSPTHLKRAGLIFSKQFTKIDRKISIIHCPSKYTIYEPKNWYKKAESRNAVLTEYLKLFLLIFN